MAGEGAYFQPWLFCCFCDCGLFLPSFCDSGSQAHVWKSLSRLGSFRKAACPPLPPGWALVARDHVYLSLKGEVTSTMASLRHEPPRTVVPQRTPSASRETWEGRGRGARCVSPDVAGETFRDPQVWIRREGPHPRRAGPASPRTRMPGSPPRHLKTATSTPRPVTSQLFHLHSDFETSPTDECQVSPRLQA